MKLIKVHKKSNASCLVCNKGFLTDKYAIDLRYVGKTSVGSFKWKDPRGKEHIEYTRFTPTSGKVVPIHIQCVSKLIEELSLYSKDKLPIDINKIVANEL